MATETTALSMQSVCQQTGISMSMLYLEFRAGRGPKTFRVGRRRLARREAVEQWIQAREQAASETAN